MADRPFDLTINRFPVPPITDAAVVDNVLHNRGGWTTLERVTTDRLAEERAARRARRDYHTQRPIPQPEFDSDEN